MMDGTSLPAPKANDDDVISLMELLRVRGLPLSERDLWAVCRACALDLISFIEDGFGIGSEQMLLVTPKSVVLRRNGSVEFQPIQVASEEFEDYLPPELIMERLGGTVKPSALVFSLAATLFMAADFNLPDDEEPAITEEMELLLSTMTDEDTENRADLRTVSELAADGLMVCEDNDDITLCREIVIGLYSAARSIIDSKADMAPIGSVSETILGSRTTALSRIKSQSLHLIAPGAPLRIVPKNERKRPLCVLMDRDRLLAEIKGRPILTAVAKRVERSRMTRHIARIAPPSSYVTPHDVLLKEITNRTYSLKPVAVDGSEPGEEDYSSKINNSSSSSMSSSTVSDLTGQSSVIKSEKLEQRKLKVLPVFNIDIFADWNPVHQVKLGFAAESGAQEVPASKLSAKNGSVKDMMHDLAELPLCSLNQYPPKLRLLETYSSKTSQGSTTSMNSIGNTKIPGTIEVKDWRHIRTSLVRAQLETLFFENPILHMAVSKKNCCGSCYTKLGYFKPGKKCVVCTLMVCSNCSPTVAIPAHILLQLQAIKPERAKYTTVCKSCKNVLEV